MAAPPPATVRAPLARAVRGWRRGTRHATVDCNIRVRPRAGLLAGTILVRWLFDDERAGMIARPACSNCVTQQALPAHHLIPRTRVGRDGGVNLVVPCRACNGARLDGDVLSPPAGRGRFPALRRYLELVIVRRGQDGLIDAALDDPHLYQPPVRLDATPCRYPRPAGLRS